ncbi:TetR/AcrR family transcriptional regulator [Nocardia sp. NPDC003345]
MAGRTRGISAGLTRERIAVAAVALVDRDGLERFGVRRLAEELGVDPMSIYNHIKGKAALLDAVTEAVLAEVDTDIDGEWEDIARTTAHNYRAMVGRHPQVAPLLATRPQVSPVALAALERLVAAMRRAGLPDEVVADTPLLLFGFLHGYLLAVLNGESASTGEPPAIDTARYPVLASLGPRTAGFGSVAEFDRILDTLLAGIRARAAVRSATAAPCRTSVPDSGG